MRTPYSIDSRPLRDRLTCGDFAECFPLDEDRHAIVVGDVAGRGEAAGVAAGALLIAARCALTSRKPLRAGLSFVDDVFTSCIMSDDVPLATLFIAVADAKEGVLEYASAGHEVALLFTSPARHEHLNPTGPLLGLERLAYTAFAQRRLAFSHESFLVVVTDGITESRRYEGGRPIFFGSTGVARAIAQARRSAEDPARAIADAAAGHSRGHTFDDATAMVVDLGRLALVDSLLKAVREGNLS